jgi:hypothetical protein
MPDQDGALQRVDDRELYGGQDKLHAQLVLPAFERRHSRLAGAAPDGVIIEASASSTSAPDGQSSFTTCTGDVATVTTATTTATTGAVYSRAERLPQASLRLVRRTSRIRDRFVAGRE